MFIIFAHMEYDDIIDKATHDSKVILNNILSELCDKYHNFDEMKSVIRNEFRERVDVWRKFEKGNINK